MDIDSVLALSSNPLLPSCASSTRTALLANGQVHEFEPGSLLIGEGDPAGVVLFPLGGSLQMTKTTQRGRRQVFCNPTAKACGGLCVLTLNDRALADIRGITAGTVLLVSREQFLPLTHQDPVLCQAAWHSASSCMAHLSDLVTQLSFNTVAKRVAAALVHGTGSNGDSVRLTQAELAAEVGTTREVVARCLATLQAGGMIHLRRGRIIVLDRDRLDAEH